MGNDVHLEVLCKHCVRLVKLCLIHTLGHEPTFGRDVFQPIGEKES